MASLFSYYTCYFERCSSELAELILHFPYWVALSARYSDILVSNGFFLVQLDVEIPCTQKVFLILISTYNLSLYKREILG